MQLKYIKNLPINLFVSHVHVPHPHPLNTLFLTLFAAHTKPFMNPLPHLLELVLSVPPSQEYEIHMVCFPQHLIIGLNIPDVGVTLHLDFPSHLRLIYKRIIETSKND